MEKNHKNAIPQKRQEKLKWNGWGYNDSKFVYKEDTVTFTGEQYKIGKMQLPRFKQWCINKLGVDFSRPIAVQELSAVRYVERVVNSEFMKDFRTIGISFSEENPDLLFRAHGHSLRDIYTLRNSMFERIPDLVAWPKSDSDVSEIVALAVKHNVVIISFGGGTNVSGAVSNSVEERRMIVSLDTSQMNRILWINKENYTARVQAGIIGQDLERILKQEGFTTGHEPDSYEFSSLGGWVSTRASGMKKNRYGNIDDIVVNIRMITGIGPLEYKLNSPRISCGPNILNVIMGSEGTFGVVTEVTIKICKIPDEAKYGSVVFPNFEIGTKFLKALARAKCFPSSVRLMDNEQFQFGQSLKSPGTMSALVDRFKKAYVTKWHGFNLESLCALTILMEGSIEEVELQEKKIKELARSFSGLISGEANGETGYTLTFVIAYIRDLGLNYNVLAESFETSVPWDRTLILCKNVKSRVAEDCEFYKIRHFLISCRVTQIYDSGAVVYFYLALNLSDCECDQVELYEKIEHDARDEILKSGGSLSHHHGIGKLKSHWMPKIMSPAGLKLLKSIKESLDPTDIFSTGNLAIKSKL